MTEQGESGPSDQPVLQMRMPDDKVAGVHADFVSAWHTPDTFILDFATIVQPAHPGVTPTGDEAMILDAQIVARVKIPPAQVFEIMKALEQQLGMWEKETGNGQPPPQR